MGLATGGAKPSLALTTLRRETLDDMTRGRLRGWAMIGAVVFAVLACLAWPDLLAVVLGLGVAVVLALVSLWLHLSLPDAETATASNTEVDDTRDATTGAPD